VNKALFAMLTETEKKLLLDTEPSALRGLDEDDLAALHDRVRRTRNTYSKLYRRRAAAPPRRHTPETSRPRLNPGGGLDGCSHRRG
jgi:hypothetical protein